MQKNSNFRGATVTKCLGGFKISLETNLTSVVSSFVLEIGSSTKTSRGCLVELRLVTSKNDFPPSRAFDAVSSVQECEEFLWAVNASGKAEIA